MLKTDKNIEIITFLILSGRRLRIRAVADTVENEKA